MNTACTDVSVIVLTYNPEWEKVKRTLNSIIGQKNVNFEIIIGDDGSENDCFDRIKSFFCDNCVNNFRFVKNEQNMGIVKNCLSSLEQAAGKYVFLTSPGDCLADDHVLEHFLNYSIKNNAKFVFGNAVFYSFNSDSKEISVFRIKAPTSPENYGTEKDIKIQKESFFFEDYVLGATYFREKELFVRYLKMVSDDCKYVEDTTTTLLALNDGHRLAHMDSIVVFYEFGTGITNGKQEQWTNTINAEITNTYFKICYNNGDNLSRYALLYRICKNSKEAYLIKLLIMLIHPKVLFYRIKKRFTLRKYHIDKQYTIALSHLLDEDEGQIKIVYKGF